MKKLLLIIVVLVWPTSAQIPMSIQLEIIQAEDARRYDKVLEGLMNWPGVELRKRAALAAGRIGDDKAIPALTKLLETDTSPAVREMAAFAIGEIESAKGTDAILKVLGNKATPDSIRARAVEAAGKIAAANPRAPKTTDLGKAILDTLRDRTEHDTIFLALTAALRARSAGTDEVVVKFLDSPDAGIRAAAGNTLTRIRAKNANAIFCRMITSDTDPMARANAARGLGAAESKDCLVALTDLAIADKDSRVRVAAIRSVGGLKEIGPTKRLLERGQSLLSSRNASKAKNPVETNELLEIATSLGRLLANTQNAEALAFLKAFAAADKYHSPETEIAIARIDPAGHTNYAKNKGGISNDWRAVSAALQGASTIAALDDSGKNKEIKSGWAEDLRKFLDIAPETPSLLPMISLPDALGAYADFKTPELGAVARRNLLRRDLFVRAAAAGILGDLPRSEENVKALNYAFAQAYAGDKMYNDAALAALNALAKVDKKAGVGTFLTALNHPDHLVRERAYRLLDDEEIKKEFPGVPSSLQRARDQRRNQVLPYNPSFGTKLGQILNTPADYRRALSRRNGTVRAVVTTEKGAFTIEFAPEAAPLTVDNFVKLARSGYFAGVMVHRVVPNFVVQDGDPRGDGNGGPGWSIRCEINMLPFDRGAVGMALSGKDTGGSQYFVDHSPQPHLDGGYTVFGHVDEEGMKVVEQIIRGDKILSVKIVEGRSPQKGAKAAK